MDRLYAPWRSSYATDTDNSKKSDATPEQCVFCKHLEDNTDEKHFIFRRFNHNFIMLNLFPYNAGHVMVLPFAHVSSLQDLPLEARAEMMELTTHCIEIVTKVLGAQGANMGMNFGKISGAGIPSHLHMHIVPRWLGDTNFLPVIGNTKQISFDLVEIYKKLKIEIDKI